MNMFYFCLAFLAVVSGRKILLNESTSVSSTVVSSVVDVDFYRDSIYFNASLMVNDCYVEEGCYYPNKYHSLKTSNRMYTDTSFSYLYFTTNSGDDNRFDSYRTDLDGKNFTPITFDYLPDSTYLQYKVTDHLYAISSEGGDVSEYRVVKYPLDSLDNPLSEVARFITDDIIPDDYRVASVTYKSDLYIFDGAMFHIYNDNCTKTNGDRDYCEDIKPYDKFPNTYVRNCQVIDLFIVKDFEDENKSYMAFACNTTSEENSLYLIDIETKTFFKEISFHLYVQNYESCYVASMSYYKDFNNLIVHEYCKEKQDNTPVSKVYRVNLPECETSSKCCSRINIFSHDTSLSGQIIDSVLVPTEKISK